MRDTLDLTPPQRTPVIRSTTAGRPTAAGAEQSWNWQLGLPFEDGAEQSLGIMWQLPFEDGAEQLMSWYPPYSTPFE